MRQRYLEQDAYNTASLAGSLAASLAASESTAVEKYAEQDAKKQRLDALFSYLDWTKMKQGLQHRINLELQSQVEARGMRLFAKMITHVSIIKFPSDDDIVWSRQISSINQSIITTVHYKVLFFVSLNVSHKIR